jgi:methionyl-tRNA formyltransferase
MRVLFAGSPIIAVPSLESLFNMEGIEIAGILTNPDTPRGRHGTPQPTDVGEIALKLGITSILKPAKLDTSAREQVRSLNPDILVSFAYGRIFGPKFLALFPLGGINVHPSLLPKYRGPTPIQAAILNRDKTTGITIQILANEMDCGDILKQIQLQLNGDETAGTLSETAAQKAAVLLPEVLKKIAAGTINRLSQDQTGIEISYCKTLSIEDGFINWNCSAEEIEAKIRGFTPWPLCRTVHKDRELIILEADVFTGNLAQGVNLPGQVLGIDQKYGILIQTGEGVLAVTRLQYQAKKALFWRDFLNGARDFTGSHLK